MSTEYDQFKAETIKASDVITKAQKMMAVTDEFAEGFHKAMWEAREIYMRLEDEEDSNVKKIEITLCTELSKDK